MAKVEESPKFEEALGRLEQIVQTLEAGNLPLEESLKAFEEGIALARLCANQLEAAERRIELLTKDEADILRTLPFSGDAEEGKEA